MCVWDPQSIDSVRNQEQKKTIMLGEELKYGLPIEILSTDPLDLVIHFHSLLCLFPLSRVRMGLRELLK